MPQSNVGSAQAESLNVRNSVEALQTEVRGLLEQLEALETRLDPVLEPRGPDKAMPPSGNTPPNMQFCPVINHVGDIHIEVKLGQERVAGIMRRLQV